MIAGTQRSRCRYHIVRAHPEKSTMEIATITIEARADGLRSKWAEEQMG